jgi:methyl-accepting chemotaxis protein
MLRRFTIGQRLAAAFALPVLLMAVLGGTAIWIARLQSEAFNDFSERVSKTSKLALELEVSLAQMRRYEKDASLTLIFPDQAKAYIKSWTEESEHASKLQAALELRVADPEDKQRMLAVGAAIQRYREVILPVLAKVQDQAYRSPDEAHTAAREASKHHREADRLLNEELAALETSTAAVSAKINGLNRAILVGSLAAVMAACALLGAAGWFITRSIVAPMRAATTFAGNIRDGDLSTTLADEGRDETAVLMHTMREMQAQLARIVGDVRRSADSIQTASSEVAIGNSDLSQRTEQTASSLQQTASSIEQLSGTVKQTADSARTANQLAASAAQVAQRGGTVVTQVVGTMGEISTASRKIADIISTIDGIAFQTNILALNAAVEAARAGEQGRGFAVVAGEVRSLAQRSAEAAKQIKGLIGASVDRVESGTKLVADAGTTMAEIVASVQRVSDIIGEISAASNEQSAGIGQVNTTVTELDRMTQQNAALVEQSAAAAESLQEQAVKLASTVAAFKLGHAAPAAPAPAALRRAPMLPLSAAVAAPAAPTAHEAAAKQAIQRARRPEPAAAPANEGDWETF